MTGEKRFLVEFEIESHACLVDGLEEQALQSDDGTEYYVSNLSTDLGNPNPLLLLRIILTATDFADAENIGTDKAINFTRLICLASNLPCQTHRLTKIADWSIGIEEREAKIASQHPGHDLPHKILKPEIFRTINALLSLDIPSEVTQAIKWHAYGVLSRYTDEQFQFFWLALEILAQVGADRTKVNDPCPVCHSPLYCEKCKNYPLHRPHEWQLISALFERVNPEHGAKIFKDASQLRNVISHGRDVGSFVEKKNIDLNDLVNAIGALSWAAVVTHLETHAGLNQKEQKYLFSTVSSYVRITLNVSTNLTFKSKDPDQPRFSEIPSLNTELIIEERPETEP